MAVSTATSAAPMLVHTTIVDSEIVKLVARLVTNRFEPTDTVTKVAFAGSLNDGLSVEELAAAAEVPAWPDCRRAAQCAEADPRPPASQGDRPLPGAAKPSRQLDVTTWPYRPPKRRRPQNRVPT